MLLQKFQSKLRSLLFSGNERSVRAKRNIFSMLFIKGGTLLIGLLLVPLTIGYVDSETYGVWLTISSIVAWVSFFDIGINNGLKNKLAESLARGDIPKARKYVSTTYALLALIFIPLMFILLFVSHALDWSSLLKVTSIDSSVLTLAVDIVIIYFCLNFILSTINVVMLADQRPADESLRVFVQQLLSLAVIFLLTEYTDGSLISLCLALCICPLSVSLLFNITLFAKRYQTIAPSFTSVDFGLSSDLLRLGVQFFLIQIAGVVQYQMINFLIIRNFGADDVTAYNIAYKYMNIVYMVWAILTVPIWASVTDAVTKGDFPWIRGTVSKYLKALTFFTLVAVLMLLCSPFVYRIWIGDKVSVPFAVTFWLMLYNVVFMFGSVFVNVLNGAGLLKVQTLACIISPFVFLLLCSTLKKSGIGVESIIIASIISNFNAFLLAPLQYRKFIRDHECCK